MNIYEILAIVIASFILFVYIGSVVLYNNRVNKEANTKPSFENFFIISLVFIFVDLLLVGFNVYKAIKENGFLNSYFIIMVVALINLIIVFAVIFAINNKKKGIITLSYVLTKVILVCSTISLAFYVTSVINPILGYVLVIVGSYIINLVLDKLTVLYCDMKGLRNFAKVMSYVMLICYILSLNIALPILIAWWFVFICPFIGFALFLIRLAINNNIFKKLEQINDNN